MDNTIKLKNAPLCFLSINTTGMNINEGAEIYEIGMLLTHLGRIEKKLHWFVQTKTPLHENLFLIKKITKKDVDEAKPIKQVLEQVARYLDKRFVISIHSTHLVQFLDGALQKHVEEKFKNVLFDLQWITKKLFEGTGYISISDLAAKLGVEAADSRQMMPLLTAKFNIFHKIIPLLEEKGVDTVLSLRDFQGRKISAAHSLAATVMSMVEKAMAERQTIHIHYYSPYSGRTSRRDVDPYEIHTKDRAKYLIGYCHTKGEFRFFNFDRITDLVETGKTFERSSDYSLPDFFK
ncbi:WYL domain-containing protein [bacterium]|nr:WYL domain-containing protein [bacterium]